jgi:ADP-ribosylation factor protein 6
MKDALLLVFANKQDLSGGAYTFKSTRQVNALTPHVAMRPKEVSDRLQLDKIAKDHVWKVEPSCATTGEGIFEGLVR